MATDSTAKEKPKTDDSWGVAWLTSQQDYYVMTMQHNDTKCANGHDAAIDHGSVEGEGCTACSVRFAEFVTRPEIGRVFGKQMNMEANKNCTISVSHDNCSEMNQLCA
jgi:hypothetical protein